MGNSQSLPAATLQPAAQAKKTPQHRRTEMSLDEKFDAVRIDTHDEPHSYSYSYSYSSSSNKVIASDGSGTVNADGTTEYVHDLLQDKRNKLGLYAMSTHGPTSVLHNPAAALKDMQYFNLAIPHEGSPVTNQRSSGRCWIFAATNVFRIAIQKKYDIKSFELSQAYLFFWDKVEKSNYFLESMLESADQPVDSRLITYFNAAPVGDGGQWDMIINLVSKYGIVPQELYPDTWNAENSRSMDSLLSTKLREDGFQLRKLKSSNASSEKIAAAKNRMMQDVVRMLTLMLGPPPSKDEKFTWQFYDSSHKFKTASLTPLEFAASTHVAKFFSLVHDPRNDFNSLLTVEHLGNVWKGRPITYVNVDKQVLKSAAINMLKKGLPVFFGSDVGKFSDRKTGILDTNIIDYELGFDIKLRMNKAQRLKSGDSLMTHAMVITAAHLDSKGRPERWRIENSWGPLAGDHGYYVMSDKWMDEYVYQIVVDPSAVDEEVRKILDQEPIELPPWDPMGALA